MRIVNDTRLTKVGKELLRQLLEDDYVIRHHKTLLRGISDRVPKNNLSKADCEIFASIAKNYVEV